MLILLGLVTLGGLLCADAKVGYDIHVCANNSTMQSCWSRSQSTTPLVFHMEGSLSGEGNSSMYSSIAGIAGITVQDRTSTKKGQLRIEDNFDVYSYANYIIIDQNWNNDLERYSVEINESLPTFLFNEKKILYRGEGINTRDEYENNQYKFYTKYKANNLQKATKYAASYANSIITAEVTPSNVRSTVTGKISAALGLSSSSDRYSELGVLTESEEIIENYWGAFQINRIIIKEYNSSLHKEEEELIECCFLGREALRHLIGVTSGYQSAIF